ncbi:hypothetical protein F511_35809 [Dorcoceras hygrometricum]|uniref:Uncharacterized protein n=1 Tax=Dorcoceras hygrometricum TaxID=472368 RepID=A0A2Z7CCD9_9LAMI|nr:hypothetical protein F511_35809 [Dorcoceras hygrometricum]
MVKRLATSPHDPLGITDSACKNQSVMISVQCGPFNTIIPIRSTTIGKSRVARDPTTMHTSWRSNSDIACVTRLLPCRRLGAWLQPDLQENWLFTVGGGRSSNQFQYGNHESSTCVTLNGSGIQLAVGPQPLWLRNHNFGLAQRIMEKCLATSPHDPLGITDSAYKNQLVVVSVQYDPFNTYIPIRSMTIRKSRVARDPTAMHMSWRSNSDIASVTR